MTKREAGCHQFFTISFFITLLFSDVTCVRCVHVWILACRRLSYRIPVEISSYRDIFSSWRVAHFLGKGYFSSRSDFMRKPCTNDMPDIFPVTNFLPPSFAIILGHHKISGSFCTGKKWGIFEFYTGKIWRILAKCSPPLRLLKWICRSLKCKRSSPLSPYTENNKPFYANQSILLHTPLNRHVVPLVGGIYVRKSLHLTVNTLPGTSVITV